MNIDRFFTVFRTAARGLKQQRMNIRIASQNIANAGTTRGLDGSGPYEPKRVIASASEYQSFGPTLQNTVLEMRTTNSFHRSSPSIGFNAGGSRNLGPELDVVEQEKYRYEYDPNHPDADENGMVKYPDIDMVEEMTHIVSAKILYNANLSVIEAQKQIIKHSFRI